MFLYAGDSYFLLWTHGVIDDKQENEVFLSSSGRCVLREGVGFSSSWQRQPGVGEEHGCCRVPSPRALKLGC